MEEGICFCMMHVICAKYFPIDTKRSYASLHPFFYLKGSCKIGQFTWTLYEVWSIDQMP
jgi:hypothetical protein